MLIVILEQIILGKPMHEISQKRSWVQTNIILDETFGKQVINFLVRNCPFPRERGHFSVHCSPAILAYHTS